MAYGEWPNGSRYCNQMRRFSTKYSTRCRVKTLPQRSWWPSVKETFKTGWLTLSEWACPLNNCPEIADGLSKKDISILAFVRVSSSNFLRIFFLPSWQNSTVKEEHQLLVPVSFSPLSESCLKIKKGKGYI